MLIAMKYNKKALQLINLTVEELFFKISVHIYNGIVAMEIVK